MSAAWTVRARAELWCVYIRARIIRAYTRVGIATNPHTPGIIVLPLSACVFYG